MSLRQETREGAVVVRLAEESLRGPDLQVTGEELFALAGTLGRRELQLDFAEVGYLTNLALAKLVALDKQVKAAGGRLVLVNVEPRVYEVFDTTRLSRLFTLRLKKPLTAPAVPLADSGRPETV